MHSYVFTMWLLLALFCLRVVGQLAVCLGLAPALPSFDEWQSGLLPYPCLVLFQVLIIGLYTRMCLDLSFKKGFFSRARRKLTRILRPLALVYFFSMPLRYCVYMAFFPEARWFHGTIPIVFHMVLAGFLLCYVAMTGELEQQAGGNIA